MANPVLESFGESPKACVTNFSRPPEKLKGKENPDLPSVCLKYWPPIVALMEQTKYTWSLAPVDLSGAVFTLAHFQKIAQISSLCGFYVLIT